MAEDIRKTGPVGLRGLKGLNQLPSSEQIERERRAALTGSTGPSLNTSTQLESYAGTPMESWGTSQYDEEILNAPVDAGQLQDTRYENQPWYDVLANGVGKMFGRAGTTFVSSLVGLPYGLFEVAKEGDASKLWDNDVTKALSDVDKWMEENLTNYQSQEQQQDPYFRLGDLNWWADNVITNAGFTLGAAASMAVGSGALGLMSRSLGFVNNVSNTTKAGAAFLSSLFSATGEGMIEAKQGVEERNKLEYQKLDDAFAPEKAALDQETTLANQEYAATRNQSLVMGPDGRAVDPAYERYKQKMLDIQAREQDMQQRYNAGRQQIEESGQRMGNIILGLNQVLLTAGNLIQFGKGAVKSFDSARHAAEVASKSAKPFGMRAVRAGEALKDGYKVVGRTFGKAMVAPKNMVKEGAEEMNQQWIQSGSGAYYNEKDVNDYWKAKLDPEAYNNTTEGLHTLGSAISQGFNESWGDFNQYEQFLIGAMTGAGGVYMPTKIFNQDKTKSKWNPQRYGEWSGGAWQDISEYNQKANQFQENVDELNAILASEDFPARVRSMVGHTYTQGEKDAAAESDDKKAWKDADDKQNIHDIQAFLRAGKLDDLRAIYDEIGKEVTPEDIQNIIKSTTKEITAEEDRQNFNRQADEQIAAHQRRITELQQQAQDIADSQDMLKGAERVDYQTAVRPELEKIFGQIDEEYDAISQLEQQKEQYVPQRYFEGAYVDREGNQIVSDDEIKQIIKHNSEELNRKLDSYLDSIVTVQEMTKGQLSKDQEDNLAYLHNVSAEKTVRVDKIMSNARKQLPSKFLLKTEKTPEQLAKQFGSSDLAFSRDDSIKKGYVEVDTGLMNDKAFAAFFINNVIGGQNIEAKDAKEGQKESEQQLRTNEDLIRQAFVNNAMQKNGMSLEQAMNSKEYDSLIDDINDAVQLHSEASEFYNTYLEYMLNPSKVDQDRAKEEKKVEEKQRKEKVDGASLDEMLGMSDDDLAAILNDGKKGKNKAGNKARKAMGMKNGRQKVKKELDAAVKSGALDEETASDAMKLFDEQLNRMAQEDDDTQMNSMDAFAAKAFDTDTEAMNDPEVLLTPQELEDLETGRVEFDEAAYDARVAKAKDAINSIADPIAKQLQEMEDAIDKDVLNKALDDDDSPSEKAAKAVEKAADEEKKNKKRNKKNAKNKAEEAEPLKSVSVQLKTFQQEPIPTSEGDPKELVSDMKDGTANKNTPGENNQRNWHPWMSSTSEVGQYTNEPYKANDTDPNLAAFKQRRYDAIRKKLVEVGAYQRRREGLVTEGMKVGFKVFQDVNDEAGDFVIFITDEQGNIIGDLPSNDPRLDTSRRDIPMDDIYKAVQEEWEDAQDDEKQAGMQSSYQSVVDHVLVGKVLYQGERQTVSQLTAKNGSKPLFAIKTKQGMQTGYVQTEDGTNTSEQMVKGQIHLPKAGKYGQPYVLIETPNGYQERGGFKYYAVPVTTKRIGDLPEDSAYIKLLKSILVRIKETEHKKHINDSDAKKLLQALIAVSNVHVNLEEGSDTKKELGIRFTSFADSRGQRKGDDNVIYSGKREDMNIDEIMQKLGDFYVNISLDYLNGRDAKKLRSLLTVDGQPITEEGYNEIIAEIAETNAAEPETVNNWFTIKPMTMKEDKLTVVDDPNTMTEWDDIEMPYTGISVIPQIGGLKGSWTVKRDDSGWHVYDENDKEIIPKKKDGSGHSKAYQNEATAIAAEAAGRMFMKDFSKPFVVHLWGKSVVYDPKTRKVVSVDKFWKDLGENPRYNGALLGQIQNDPNLSEEERLEAIQEVYNAAKPKEPHHETITWDNEDNNVDSKEEKPTPKDHTEEVNKKIAEMEEDTDHWDLVKWDEEQQKYVKDDNGDYYQDDRDGSIHARVSNVNDADIEVIEANEKAGFDKPHPQLKLVSTAAGNVVDRFVRDAFNYYNLKGELTDAEINNIAEEMQTPNINKEDAANLIKALSNLQNQMGADWVINSTGIVASGMVSFDGENAVNVAGTIDLLAYNPKKGQYVIIDMKSSLAKLFDKNGKIKSDAKTQAKLAHWRAQQTLYKNFLEKKFGIKISGIRIMPFSVSYNTNFAETDYELGDDGVLRDKGIAVNIHPSLAGKLFTLTPKTDVKYQTSQLPESVKRLLPKKPLVRKPDLKQVPVKQELLSLRDKLPEGRHLKEFLKEEYAKDLHIPKLLDSLEKDRSEEHPLLLTKATQERMLNAIDQDALENVVQEEKAKEQQIILGMPSTRKSQKTRDDAKNSLTESGMFDEDELELLEELPDNLYIIAADNQLVVKELLNTEGIEGVESYLTSSDATRHKKAKEGSYKILDLQKELRWMTRNLPQISKERKLQIIKGLVACSDGTWDFGRVEHGVMVIGTQAEEGTVYHEAFHYVVQFLMTDNEIDTMFKEAEKKYGKMPIVALEERLADDFADYVKGVDPEENKIKRFFRELWNAIRAMFGNKPYIETLFRNINTGVYAGTEFRDDRSNVFASINPETRQLAKNYEYLNNDERIRISEARVGKDTYNQLSKEQQEYMLHCVI